MNADSLYNILSARIVGNLVGFALAMGIAAVAWTYIQRALSDEGWARSSDVWRHLVLLFSIMLFFAYIDVSYEIEFYKGERLKATRQMAQLEDVEAESFLPRIRLLLLLPIDMIGIGLMASLFAVLIVFGTNQAYWAGPSMSTSLEVLYLLALTAAWHVSMIGWWLVYGLTAKDVTQVLGDVVTHALFGVVELVSLVVLRFARSSRWGTKNSAIIAWISVGTFSLIFFLMYAVRLWDYSLRFFVVSGGSA